MSAQQDPSASVRSRTFKLSRLLSNCAPIIDRQFADLVKNIAVPTSAIEAKVGAYLSPAAINELPAGLSALQIRMAAYTWGRGFQADESGQIFGCKAMTVVYELRKFVGAIAKAEAVTSQVVTDALNEIRVKSLLTPHAAWLQSYESWILPASRTKVPTARGFDFGTAPSAASAILFDQLRIPWGCIHENVPKGILIPRRIPCINGGTGKSVVVIDIYSEGANPGRDQPRHTYLVVDAYGKKLVNRTYLRWCKGAAGNLTRLLLGAPGCLREATSLRDIEIKKRPGRTDSRSVYLLSYLKGWNPSDARVHIPANYREPAVRPIIPLNKIRAGQSANELRLVPPHSGGEFGEISDSAITFRVRASSKALSIQTKEVTGVNGEWRFLGSRQRAVMMAAKWVEHVTEDLPRLELLTTSYVVFTDRRSKTGVRKYRTRCVAFGRTLTIPPVPGVPEEYPLPKGADATDLAPVLFKLRSNDNARYLGIWPVGATPERHPYLHCFTRTAGQWTKVQERFKPEDILAVIPPPTGRTYEPRVGRR